MTELSENAKTVLGGTFGWGQILTFGMVENIPSPEMQEALDELVDGGMLVRQSGLEDMSRTAIRYKLAEDFDVEPFRKMAAESIFNNTAPSIRIFVKRT